jgi:hypothetical protein
MTLSADSSIIELIYQCDLVWCTLCADHGDLGGSLVENLS